MNDGAALSALLISSADWVYRRVHVLDHTMPGRVRIQETLDVRIPEHEVILGSTDKLIVPISILPKGVLWSWWVEGGQGAPLSVIQRTESSKLVRAMLVDVLKKAGVSYPYLEDRDNRLLKFVNNGENTQTESADDLICLCRRFAEPANTANIEFVIDLIKVLESSWVVLVEIPMSLRGQRTLLRYGYDLKFHTDPLDVNKDNDSYREEIRDPGFSQSLHLEVRVPPELEVYELSLVNRSADQMHSIVIGDSEVPNSVAHIQNDPYTPRFSVTNFEFRLRPSKSGITQFTDAALATVSSVTLILLTLRLTGVAMLLESNWRTHTTAAVILALPALLLSWIARSPEPEVVRRAFHRLRLINIYLAISVFSMAAALSTLWKPLAWNFLWYIPVACSVMGLILRYLEHVQRLPSTFDQEERRRQ